MKVRNVEYKDAIEIKKLLVHSPSIVDSNRLLPEILEHIGSSDSIATIVEDEGKILGVWLSKELDEYISLSYFYIAEELRMKSIVLKFFAYNYNLVKEKNKNILIKANDLTGFERYVVHVEDDIYIFKGFR